ncbi:MAG TPA: GAF domain-containing protein [Bacteroidales bacterium]|nr:GAF domain-containing protein [Bacteroidales bacterium]
MFFIIFKLVQVIIEEETTLQKILQQNEVLVENASTEDKKEEYKDVNIDELVQKIIPAIPQNQSLDEFCGNLLTNLSKQLNIVQGIVYCKNNQTSQFELKSTYALYTTEPINPFFEGETLPGQVAADKKAICITDVPDNYFRIASGLGSAKPKHVVIFPIIDKEHTIAVVEIATFQKIEDNTFEIFNKLSAILGKILVKLK